MIIDKSKEWESQTEDKRTFKMKWTISPEMGEYTKEEIEAEAEQYEGVDAGDILITCTMVELEDRFVSKWQGYDARKPDADGDPGNIHMATLFQAWAELTLALSRFEEIPPPVRTILKASVDACEVINNLAKKHLADRNQENPLKS